MGRISKSLKDQYATIESPIIEKETDRYILPKGTEVYCENCGETTLKRMKVGKRIRCSKCGKELSVMIDDKVIPFSMMKDNPTFEKELGFTDYIPETSGKTGTGKSKRKITKPIKRVVESEEKRQKKFDFKFFIFEDSKVKNKELVDESRGKDLPVFLANISNVDLIHSWLERESYSDEMKNHVAVALVDRKLLNRAKKYEKEFNKYLESPEEEKERPVDEVQSEYEKLKKKRLAEEYSEGKEEEEEELTEEEEEVKKQLEEKARKSDKVKRIVDHFGIDKIAKSFCAKNVRLFDTFFDEYPLTEDEKEELLSDWQFVLEFHIDDLTDYIDFLGVFMLILTNITLLAVRVKPMLQKYMAERKEEKESKTEKPKGKEVVEEEEEIESKAQLPKWRKKELARKKK